MKTEKKNRLRLLISLVAILTFIMLMAVTPDQAGAATGKEIKIGALLNMTGSGASEGVEQKISLEMARDEINAAGGIGGVPVNLIMYDTGSDPKQAINMANKLIYQDEVLEVIGPAFSSEVEVTFPVAVRGKTPMIATLSTKPGLAEKNRPWAFRNTARSDILYNEMMKIWARDNKIKTVAIIYDKKDRFTQNDGAEMFPKLLKDLGVKIVGDVTFMTGDMDFSAQITKVRGWNPDGIAIAALREDAAHLVTEARKQGLKTPIVAGAEVVVPLFRELSGAAAEGIYSAHSTWTDNPDPMMAQFKEKFEKNPKKIPIGVGSVRVYDIIHMTKMIMEKTGVTNKPEDLQKDRERIQQGWATLKNYKGVEGLTSINKEGEAEKEVYVLKVVGGKFQRVQ